MKSLLNLSLICCLTLAACKKDGGGGSALEESILLSDRDVVTLSDDLSNGIDLALLMLQEIPAPSLEKDQPDAPCLTTEETDDGDRITVEGTINHCRIPTRRHGPVVVQGAFMLEGQRRPSEEELGKFLEDARASLPDLDALLANSGRLSHLTDLQATYQIDVEETTTLDIELVETIQSVATYQRDRIWIGSFDTQMVTEEGIPLVTTLTAVLAVDTDQLADMDNQDLPSTPFSVRGLASAILRIEGADSAAEFVTFNFDGSPIAQFEMALSARTGQIDLRSGELIFD